MVLMDFGYRDPNRQWGAFMGGKTFPVPDQKADVFDVCGTSDFVCGMDKKGPSGSHMSYVTNGSVQKAAEFVVERFQTKRQAAA